MDTVLVTGGAGFLGGHVAHHLMEMGLRVVVVDDLSGGFKRNVPAGAVFRHTSITDPAAVHELFQRFDFRYVYHLAAYAAEGLSHFVRHFTYSTNVLGSVNLINAAVNHRVECFVFTSSIAVYGSGQAPFTENVVPIPGDPYGIAKLAVEQDLRAAKEMFGLRSIIFRPHNVYGEGQNLADPYRNVVGIFMRQAALGEPCSVFGDGTQTRAFSHVSDVTPLIATSVRIAEAYDETINVGADHSHTVLELARMVQQAMGREVGVRHLPARHEVAHASSDHAKARRIFGCRPAVALEDGLRRMAAWAAQLELAPPREVRDVEITRNLPAAWARPLTTPP